MADTLLADVAEIVCECLPLSDVAALLSVSRLWRHAAISTLSRRQQLSLGVTRATPQCFSAAPRVAHAMGLSASATSLHIAVTSTTIPPAQLWQCLHLWLNSASRDLETVVLDVGSVWPGVGRESNMDELEQQAIDTISSLIRHYSHLKRVRIVSYAGVLNLRLLATTHPTMSHLSTLPSFHGLTLTNPDWLPRFTHLRSLELFEVVDDALLEAIAHNCPDLTCVRLYECPVTSRGIATLLSLSHLRALGIASCDSVEFDCAILELLKCDLEYLELSGLVADLTALPTIARCRELKYLDLASTIDSSPTLPLLAQSILTAFRHLECLDVRYSQLQPHLVALPVQALHPPSLRLLPSYEYERLSQPRSLPSGVRLVVSDRDLADIVHRLLWAL